MASKRHIRTIQRQKVCGHKVPYPSLAEAHAALRCVYRNPDFRGLFRVYECAYCHSYHFGHVKPVAY